MTGKMRKRGRPALGPGKGRESVVVSFRLTKGEHAAYTALAEERGMTLAAYTRDRLRFARICRLMRIPDVSGAPV